MSEVRWINNLMGTLYYFNTPIIEFKIEDRKLIYANDLSNGKYYPHELSGGMKQRAAIARALALHPKIVLMDEPFAALDAITRNRLQKELADIAASEHMTVIFVTHNIQEAITLGTRILLMDRGGHVIIDDINPLEKPVTPSMKGYGELWDKYSTALNQENEAAH